MSASTGERRGLRAARTAGGGAILSLALVLPARAMALAGGATGSGGSSSGGSSSSRSRGSGGSGGGDGDWRVLLVIFGIVLLVAALSTMPARNALRRRRTRREETARLARTANAGDGYWDPERLEARAREGFFPIQESWERRDVSASRPYVSDALYERHALQLEGLEKQGRVNRIADLELKTVEIVRIHDVTDDGEDRFVAYIECSARDWVEDVRTGVMVNGNKSSPTRFQQYWSFVRHPESGWVLDEIQQASEGAYHLTTPSVAQDEGPLDGRPTAGAGAV